MFRRLICLALLCLALLLLGTGCDDDSTSPRENPGAHPMHTVVFLNGNDTNNVDLLVREYTDDLTLGDTLLHQFVGPGRHSDTVNVASRVKFRYTLYWADSSYDTGPYQNQIQSVNSFSDYRIFYDTDSANYAVSMRGNVVTFTGSN